MKEYDRQIAELRCQIQQAARRLEELEAERDAYEQQRQLRQQFFSSREILHLLAERHGHKGSLATIKRWADEGHLGEVKEERTHFPLLASTQGKKRFLYPKDEVCRFLYQKGLFRPFFDILDRVRLARADSTIHAIVTKAELREDRFYYSLQVEGTTDIVDDVPEEELAEG